MDPDNIAEMTCGVCGATLLLTRKQWESFRFWPCGECSERFAIDLAWTRQHMTWEG